MRRLIYKSSEKDIRYEIWGQSFLGKLNGEREKVWQTGLSLQSCPWRLAGKGADGSHMRFDGKCYEQRKLKKLDV